MYEQQQQQYQQYQQPQYQQPQYQTNATQSPKIDDVTPFCDKLREFLSRFSMNRALIGASDIIAYIATGLCFVLSILFLILDCASSGGGGIVGSLTFSTYLPFVALYFSILAVCKRTLLPLAINVTYLAAANLIKLILDIVLMSKGSSIGSIIVAFICLMFEVAILAIISFRLWCAFAVASAPARAAAAAKRQQQQMMYQQQMAAQQAAMQQQMAAQQMQQQQMSQQQMQQPAYQQPAFQQPQYQQAPVAAPAAAPAPEAAPAAAPTVATAAPAATPAPTAAICPSCSFENGAESKFCKKCGTKLG